MNETRCFVERNPGASICRRALAEFVGTSFLMFALVGAALGQTGVSPESAALSRLVSAVSIAGALTGLIVAFGPVSGAHFNPLITGLQWLCGERRSNCAAAYVAV